MTVSTLLKAENLTRMGRVIFMKSIESLTDCNVVALWVCGALQ